jgi:lipopolysaccharide transport system ATP-binding protein
MAEAAVVCDGVWKKFRRGEVNDSLRDLIPALARRAFGRKPSDDLAEREFWALRDLSFEVKPGEALGIIGPNGAGKSTTLKLLTKILRPTRGHFQVRGRIGALIEVAAGFHPDLTGRENVFLQGAIMGMRRHEITQRFDEIVEFAEVQEFLDTPVKRYSSGMNARLGFAIAAHLRPDVLIVDEVLAVGDLAFQQKAFRRLGEVVAEGVPAIVVSHQLDRVAALCSQAILLNKGTVVHHGTPAQCIGRYLESSTQRAGAGESTPIVIESLEMKQGESVASGARASFAACGRTRARTRDELIGFRVRADSGQVIFATGSERFHVDLPAQDTFRVDLDLQMNVPAGVYVLETFIWSRKHERELGQGPSVTIRVVDSVSFYGSVQMNAQMRLSGVAIEHAAPAAAAS